MQIVIHRINTIHELRNVPIIYGVEVDIRAEGSNLILNHEPFKQGERFVDYLEVYQHQLLVLNIKEAGIEAEVLRLVRQKEIPEFFLLDVEFPYIYQASRKGERAIAMRFSEDEAIQTILKYQGKVDWVWIDTNTKLPLDKGIIQQLQGFKTCLVCPERWGRPQDIIPYRLRMRELGFCLDAVMTSKKNIMDWSNKLPPETF